MYVCMYVLVCLDVRPFSNPFFGSGRQPFQYSAEGAAAPYVEVRYIVMYINTHTYTYTHTCVLT